MGNSLSNPSSMKDLPNHLNNEQYIEMVLTGNGNKDGTYFIQKRSLSDQMGNNFKQSFSSENLALGFMGLNNLTHINKTNTGNYYITKDKLDNKPLTTTSDSTEVKLFIRGYTFEHGVKLQENDNLIQNAVFTLKEKEKVSSFGKDKSKSKSKLTLKQLKSDLKKVLK